MKRALVIGAGDFGSELVRELMRMDCAVDVLDKDPAAVFALRGTACRCMLEDAWNASSLQNIPVAGYNCCFVCVSGSLTLTKRIISSLRKCGAKRIVVRVKRSGDIADIFAAGADEAVCPALTAARALEAVPAEA